MVKRMKRILIFLIRIYQNIPGTWHMKCRYFPTCSNYAIEAIETYGCCHGIVLAGKRILRCHPKGGYGYDPVPSKEK